MSTSRFAAGRFNCVAFAVGASEAVEVVPAEAADGYHGRTYGWGIQNVGAYDAYLNGTAETATLAAGWKLPAGETLPTQLASTLFKGPVWAIADGGTTDLRVVTAKSNAPAE